MDDWTLQLAQTPAAAAGPPPTLIQPPHPPCCGYFYIKQFAYLGRKTSKYRMLEEWGLVWFMSVCVVPLPQYAAQYQTSELLSTLTAQYMAQHSRKYDTKFQRTFCQANSRIFLPNIWKVCRTKFKLAVAGTQWGARGLELNSVATIGPLWWPSNRGSFPGRVV